MQLAGSTLLHLPSRVFQMNGPGQGTRWIAAIILLLLLSGLLIWAAMLAGAHWRDRAAVLRKRDQVRREICIGNMQRIQLAKEQWAQTHKVMGTEQPRWEDIVGRDKYFSRRPVCPGGGVYTIGDLFTKPRCSVPGHTLP